MEAIAKMGTVNLVKLLLLGGAALHLAWVLSHHLDANWRLPYSTSATQKDRYSIVVSTFNRVEHLHHFLNRVGRGDLPRLDAIFIAWGLGGVDPPDWLDLNNYTVPVYLERAQANSLMERFRQPKAMRTEAALFIDDDLQFDPHDIEFGFSVYQQFGRDAHRIVGYSGRQIYVDDRGTYSYDRYQSDFDIVLTNAAFLDTRALGWLRSRDPALRESIAYVDRHMNCEDILVNFVVAAKTGQAPLLVAARNVQQLKTSGISDRPSHYVERTECATEFIRRHGMPLVSSNIILTPNSREIHRDIVPLDPPFHLNDYTPWAEGKIYVQDS